MAPKRTASNPVANARRKSRSLNWLLVIVAVALVGTVAYAMNRRHAAQREAAAPTPPPTPVPANVMANFVNISPATWEQAGTSGARPPLFVGDSNFSGAKPVVLYIGAGYCPYCAAARWSMIAALSRFGTFSGLTYARSAAEDVFPLTPTFSFYGSRYTSQYVDFESVELQGDQRMLNGQYEMLQSPTPEQEALLERYDAPPYVAKASAGGSPFILVGGRYMWSGSPFLPNILANRTQAEIAAALPAGSDTAAHTILTNGNELTAAICAVDGRQPQSVCSGPAIRAAMAKLPSAATR